MRPDDLRDPPVPSRDGSAALAAPVPAWASLAWTRTAAIGLFAVTIAWVLLTYRLHAPSNDEWVQHVYGDLLLRWYASGFADRAAFEYINLRYYGGLFDMAAVALTKVFPAADPWALRHLLSGLIGVAGLFGAFKLARLLGGEKAGIAAVLLLLLTGAWSGAMITHTKDVPFAAAMIWATYYTTRMIGHLPRVPLRLSLKLGLAVGLALGLRVGGVLAIGFIGLVVAAVAIERRRGPAFLGRATLALIPGAALAFALMALLWPWSVQDWGNVAAALTTFSHFTFDLQTKLAGTTYLIGEVPRTYLPLYLLVKLPELALFGLLALPLAVALHHGRKVMLLPLLLAAFFPIAYAVATQPALYNGVRHFTFLLPPLAVAAALGIRAVWLIACRRGVGRPVAGGFVALALVTAVPLAAVQPYGVVNYNLLAGGLPGASMKWEMDYWGDALAEAAPALEQAVRHDKGRKPWLVAVCMESFQGDAMLGPSFRITRDWPAADFFIASPQTGCDAALPGKVLAVVERLGVPLMVVKDHRPFRREAQPK